MAPDQEHPKYGITEERFEGGTERERGHMYNNTHHRDYTSGEKAEMFQQILQEQKIRR